MKEHKWNDLGSIQWSKLGLPYDSARTDYECSVCGARFSHFYHQEPNIYKAMKKAGISEECNIEVGEK